MNHSALKDDSDEDGVHVPAGSEFVISDLWDAARWAATTFKWHPESESPPIMGLVFDNPAAAHELFARWTEVRGNADAMEEIRISIIEGTTPEQKNSYAVHIYADPEGALARATIDGFVVKENPLVAFSRVNVMFPIEGNPLLLPRFKAEYDKHREFLLAPVTRRGDGQLWVDVELGVVKTKIHFRKTTEIVPGDVDYMALGFSRFFKQG